MVEEDSTNDNGVDDSGEDGAASSYNEENYEGDDEAAAANANPHSDSPRLRDINLNSIARSAQPPQTTASTKSALYKLLFSIVRGKSSLEGVNRLDAISQELQSPRLLPTQKQSENPDASNSATFTEAEVKQLRVRLASLTDSKDALIADTIVSSLNCTKSGALRPRHSPTAGFAVHPAESMRPSSSSLLALSLRLPTLAASPSSFGISKPTLS